MDCNSAGALVAGGGAGERDERRVSWMPGAEGAPFEEEEVLVVEVEWEDAGTILMD